MFSIGNDSEVVSISQSSYYKKKNYKRNEKKKEIMPSYEKEKKVDLFNIGFICQNNDFFLIILHVTCINGGNIR